MSTVFCCLYQISDLVVDYFHGTLIEGGLFLCTLKEGEIILMYPVDVALFLIPLNYLDYLIVSFIIIIELF